MAATRRGRTGTGATTTARTALLAGPRLALRPPGAARAASAATAAATTSAATTATRVPLLRRPVVLEATGDEHPLARSGSARTGWLGPEIFVVVGEIFAAR